MSDINQDSIVIAILVYEFVRLCIRANNFHSNTTKLLKEKNIKKLKMNEDGSFEMTKK